MNDFIDQYCERYSPGPWEEPLNLFTNLAFLIAALFAFQLARRQNRLNGGVLALVILLCCVGAGSALFHTFANRLTMWMDIIPILLFQLVFLWLYTQRVMQRRYLLSAGLLALFVGLSWYFSRFPQTLNNSLSYAPSLIFLSAIAIWHFIKQRNGRVLLIAASGLFLLSLTFRTTDMAFCNMLPIGTHFLWHVLNGLVLYLVMHAYIANIERND